MKISRKLRRIAAAALAVILVWGSVNLSDMGIYTVNAAEDSSGIKTPYYDDGQHKYIYDSGDILGAATHVHLFGRTVISSVHTHGNIFCQIGDLGETGTRDENNTIGGVTGKFNPLDWYHEVNYIQNELRTINASSALDILVVGNGINYREPQGGDKRWPIMTNNGEIYLDKTNHIYQDGNGTLIDFDREFQILKDRSIEWAGKDTTDGIEYSIEDKNDGSRWIDVNNLNTGDTNVFLNLTYEEWIKCGSDEITIRNLNGNTKNTGILIINIDMKDCENYLQTEWQTEPTLTLNGSGTKVTTVNSNIKGGEEFGNREYNTTEYGAYRIIYNIYDSGSNDQLYHGKVTFGGTVCGTILAPCAEITVGAVNGTVAADTIIHDGNESHRMDVCALDATRDPEETKPEDPKEEEPEDPKEEEPTKPENPGSPEDPDKPNTPDEPNTPPSTPNTPPSTPNTPPSTPNTPPSTPNTPPSTPNTPPSTPNTPSTPPTPPTTPDGKVRYEILIEYEHIDSSSTPERIEELTKNTTIKITDEDGNDVTENVTKITWDPSRNVAVVTVEAPKPSEGFNTYYVVEDTDPADNDLSHSEPGKGFTVAITSDGKVLFQEDGSATPTTELRFVNVETATDIIGGGGSNSLTSMTSAQTGERKLPWAVFGGGMSIIFIAGAVYVFRKKENIK